MKLSRKVSFWAIMIVCLWAVSGVAAPLPGLFDTGLGSGGSIDPHYTLVESPLGSLFGSSTYVFENGSSLSPGGAMSAWYALQNTPWPEFCPYIRYVLASGWPMSPFGPWIANDSTSQWIVAPLSTYRGLIADPPGTYVFQTTFNLTGFDAATASITGRWASDGDGINIIINGVSTGQTHPGRFPYGSWESFSITSGFEAGLNTLEFVVKNTKGFWPYSWDSPTALRVEFLSATASPLPDPVPIPGTTLLLGPGLLGLFGVRKRLKN